MTGEIDTSAKRAEKADEYHAIANAYASWVGDMLELLKDRIDELDLDDPRDEQLADLVVRAEQGIAAETRRALHQDEGDRRMTGGIDTSAERVEYGRCECPAGDLCRERGECVAARLDDLEREIASVRAWMDTARREGGDYTRAARDLAARLSGVGL